MPTTNNVLTKAGLIPFFASGLETMYVRLPPDQTFAKGTVLGEVNGSGIFVSYGTQTSLAQCVLEYDCLTDSYGRAWYNVAFSQNYVPLNRVTAFRKGTFRCEDLPNLDLGAVNQLGRLVQGTLSKGLISIR